MILILMFQACNFDTHQKQKRKRVPFFFYTKWYLFKNFLLSCALIYSYFSHIYFSHLLNEDDFITTKRKINFKGLRTQNEKTKWFFSTFKATDGVFKASVVFISVFRLWFIGKWVFDVQKVRSRFSNHHLGGRNLGF
jgi:hypothetical protein